MTIKDLFKPEEPQQAVQQPDYYKECWIALRDYLCCAYSEIDFDRLIANANLQQEQIAELAKIHSYSDIVAMMNKIEREHIK